jgi:hypothetical protein
LEERLKGLVILKRFPDWSAILSVYAVIVLFVYGWTVYWVLWKLPSWIYYLTTAEILLIICYAVVVNLLESLAFILGVLVLGVVAPKAWFAERFASAGSLLSLLLGLILIGFSAPIRLADSFAYTPLIQIGALSLLALCMAMLVPRYRPVAAFLEQLADRAKIFLYLSLPVSFVSLVIVIFRSLILKT